MTAYMDPPPLRNRSEARRYFWEEFRDALAMPFESIRDREWRFAAITILFMPLILCIILAQSIACLVYFLRHGDDPEDDPNETPPHETK